MTDAETLRRELLEDYGLTQRRINTLMAACREMRNNGIIDEQTERWFLEHLPLVHPGSANDMELTSNEDLAQILAEPPQRT